MLINNLFQRAEVSRVVPETAVDVNGSIMQRECSIAVEHFLEIYINERLIMKLVCTPSDLPELVIGRLFS